jgi:hypothetical protein
VSVKCCYRVVTVVSQWCHSGVTVVSQWCQSAVRLVLQWCYSGVTVCNEDTANRGEKQPECVCVYASLCVPCVIYVFRTQQRPDTTQQTADTRQQTPDTRHQAADRRIYLRGCLCVVCTVIKQHTLFIQSLFY